MSDGKTDEAPDRQRLTTSFTYSHGFGQLAPFFAGLAEGRLLATRCGHCGEAFCPPRLLCFCGQAVETWFETNGVGLLRHVTTCKVGKKPLGLECAPSFGLIAVQGCSNLFFARLEAPALPGSRLRLRPPDRAVGHPIQQAVFRAESG
ncbi:MAG: hypothetical protein Kilf2KO_04780 [Rhodospirillales bacterium]